MISQRADRKKAHLQDISSIIDKFFSSDTLSCVMSYAPIWNEWPSLVGDHLADMLTPNYVQHGRLHVTVAGHAMLHRVQLQKRSILDNINARLEGTKLTDIMFDQAQ